MGKNRSTRNDLDSALPWNALLVRLDTIVMLLIPEEYRDKEGKIKISTVAPFLYSLGYLPAEIAKMFGKKSATEIAPYLYPKKKVASDDKPRTP